MSIEITSKAAIPKANPIKMVRVYSADEKNPDDRLFNSIQASGGLTQRHYQVWKQTDSFNMQIYSGFDSHLAEILTPEEGQKFWDGISYDAEDSFTVGQVQQYLGLSYFADCKALSVNGKLAIYFEEGFTYTDNTFTVQADEIDLEGNLPDIAPQDKFVGSLIDITIIFSGGGTIQKSGTVTSIGFDPVSKSRTLVTDIDYSGLTAQAAHVELTYNAKDFDLYGFTVDFSSLDGEYRLALTLTTGSKVVKYISERQQIYDEIPNYDRGPLLEYSNSGKYDPTDATGYLYSGSYMNKVRLTGDFHITDPSGEIVIFDNQRSSEKLKAVTYTDMILRWFKISGFQLRNLQNIFEHDTLRLLGYHWTNLDFGSADNIEYTDLYDAEVTLRQIEDNRFGTHEEIETLTASFAPTTDNFISDGEAQDFVFSSNIATNFLLYSKPSWISLDDSDITDGNTVQATASENTGTSRIGTVVYKSTQFPGLTASFGVTQDAPATGGDYLNVSTNDIDVDWQAQTVSVIVDASGVWTIDSGSLPIGASINNVTANGFDVVFIANNSSSTNRTGSINVSLDSNPTVDQDITVDQIHIPSVVSWSPSTMSIGSSGGSLTPDLITDDTCNWQIEIPSSFAYIHVSAISGTGSKIPFIITVDPNSGSQRIAVIVAKNTLYPTNSIPLQIIQAGN